MSGDDVLPMHEVFAGYGINKPVGYIQKCWEENVSGVRTTFAAFYRGSFAGSLHLLAESDYSYFRERGIPEINDFNVIPPLRKLGIGNALLEAAEQLAFETCGTVGIGVGLYDSYGNAQRLYAKRGYIPDGRGLMYKLQPVVRGSEVRADDDLNLFFTKKKP
ncbi:GNAT family N-acetyltransferase [Paenibacillus sp. N4]|nr:GNAT family N-acetyltransferase [Paenibacillus vietnamensis]